MSEEIKPTHSEAFGKKIRTVKCADWCRKTYKWINRQPKLQLWVEVTSERYTEKNIFGEELGCWAIISLEAEKSGGEWYLYYRSPVSSGTQYNDSSEKHELDIGPVSSAKEARKIIKAYSYTPWVFDGGRLNPPTITTIV